MAIEFKYAYKLEIDPPKETLIDMGLAKPAIVGPGHIFKTNWNGEVGEFSMCGMEGAKIGERVTYRKHNVKGVEICPECLMAWKTDPNSQYAVWVNGKPIT